MAYMSEESSRELFSQKETTFADSATIDSGWLDMNSVSKYQLSYLGSSALQLDIQSRSTSSGDSELTTPVSYSGIFYLVDLVPRQRYMRFVLTNDTGAEVDDAVLSVKGIYGGLDGASVFPLEVSPSQFSPASLTQSVLIGKDSSGNYQNANVNQAGDLIAGDFGIEVGRGTQNGYTLWNKFGYNKDIDENTSPETIWAGGGKFVRMTSPDTLELTSTSPNDSSLGTGVQRVTIQGVDENWEDQTETLFMNGTTDVTTVNQWLGINRVSTYIAGSGGVNAGDIKLETSTGSNLQAIMPAGEGVTQQCIFFVPAGKQFMAEWMWLNAVKLVGGGGEPNINLVAIVYSAISNSTQAIFNGDLDTNKGGNVLDISPPRPFPITEKSMFCLEASSDVNNTTLNARFSGILIDIV